jgi:hypothetical protein
MLYRTDMTASYAQLLLLHCDPLGQLEKERLTEGRLVPVLCFFVKVSGLFISNFSAQSFLFFSSSGGSGTEPVAGTKRDTTVFFKL